MAVAFPSDPGEFGGGSGGVGKPLIDNLTVVRDSDGGGNSVFFTVEETTSLISIDLMRSFVNSVDLSIHMQGFPLLTGVQKFDDRSTDLIGKDNVYYWVIAIQNTGTKLVYGPVSVSNAPPITPPALDSFDVSKNAGVNGMVTLNVSLRPNVRAPGQTFRIYVNGYLGVKRDRVIHQDSETLFSFSLQQTGELVTLKCTTVANDGSAELSLAQASQKAIALDGVASPPAKISTTRACEFRDGVQVNFPPGLEPGMVAYNLYRSLIGIPFYLAQKIKSIAPSSASELAITDPAGKGGGFQYFVTAVNAQGESVPSDAVYDSSPY